MTPDQIIARIQVVAGNVLTWLVAIQAGVTWLLASGALDGLPRAVEATTVVLTGLAVAIFFIRRVTPVEPSERGILPRS